MTILKAAPEGAKVLDLGAERAARAEVRAAEGEGVPYVRLSVGYVEVKAEIPLAVADLIMVDTKAGLAGLLADPGDIDELYGEITTGDLGALTEFITGKSLGELQASVASSQNDGTNSRPTSRGTTKRISDKPVGARRRGVSAVS
jgi:hypothetical protein